MIGANRCDIVVRIDANRGKMEGVWREINKADKKRMMGRAVNLYDKGLESLERKRKNSLMKHLTGIRFLE